MVIGTGRQAVGTWRAGAATVRSGPAHRTRTSFRTSRKQPRREISIAVVAEQLPQLRRRIIVDAFVLGAIPRLQCIALGIFFRAQRFVRIATLQHQLSHVGLLCGIEARDGRERFRRRRAAGTSAVGAGRHRRAAIARMRRNLRDTGGERGDQKHRT
jgi:hypothetical protein